MAHLLASFSWLTQDNTRSSRRGKEHTGPGASEGGAGVQRRRNNLTEGDNPRSKVRGLRCKCTMVWKVQIQQLTLAGEDTTLLFALELLDAGFLCSTRDMRRETNSVQKLKLSLSFRLSTFDPLAHRSCTYSNRDFEVLLYGVLSSFSAPVAINHIHASRILPCICTPFLSRIGLLPSVDTHICIPTFTHWSVRFGVLHPESLRGGLFRYSFSRSYIFASNLLETQRLNAPTDLTNSCGVVLARVCTFQRRLVFPSTPTFGFSWLSSSLGQRLLDVWVFPLGGPSNGF